MKKLRDSNQYRLRANQIEFCDQRIERGTVLELLTRCFGVIMLKAEIHFKRLHLNIRNRLDDPLRFRFIRSWQDRGNISWSAAEELAVSWGRCRKYNAGHKPGGRNFAQVY